VINVPTVDIADTVVAIGNSSGRDIDKFETFGLTALPAEKVSAPLIGECYANLECKLIDSTSIKKYSLFIFEVVKAVASRMGLGSNLTLPRAPVAIQLPIGSFGTSIFGK
jgi:flavin reductase (DIM6/NTAB) family NADH-FMN oxidoreductase RutF